MLLQFLEISLGLKLGSKLAVQGRSTLERAGGSQVASP